MATNSQNQWKRMTARSKNACKPKDTIIETYIISNEMKEAKSFKYSNGSYWTK